MRKQEINNLNKPYNKSAEDLFNRRFDSAIGADIPSAGKLVEEIFNDLDTNTFGIRWWLSLPTEERILISDYLYQCVDSIETNLVEAKIHFLEWLGARDRGDERIADVISKDLFGR